MFGCRYRLVYYMFYKDSKTQTISRTVWYEREKGVISNFDRKQWVIFERP